MPGCPSRKLTPSTPAEPLGDFAHCAGEAGHSGLHRTVDLGGYCWEWSDKDVDPWLARP